MTASDLPSDPFIDVSILVVSYNTKDLTLCCLESLIAHTHAVSYELIVVDNASSDGSAEEIAARFGEAVAMIPLSLNIGFGRACNLASQRANGRYVLLLNPDTEVIDDSIDRLVELADLNPGRGAYGGVTLSEDRSINSSSCWRRPTPWSSFCQGVGLSALFPNSRWLSPQVVKIDTSLKLQPVDIVSGGFLLMTRDLWVKLEGFDESFFLYGEDFDLCLRAQIESGGLCIFPEVRIVHDGGGVAQPETERLVRLLRGKVMVYDRHWSPTAAKFGRLFSLIWVLTRRMAYGVLAWMGSYVDAAATWNEVWRRRAEFLKPQNGHRAIEISVKH